MKKQIKMERIKSNRWKLKLLMLSHGECFETAIDNYRSVKRAVSRLQSQIGWRWEVTRNNHGLTRAKRIEDAKP